MIQSAITKSVQLNFVVVNGHFEILQFGTEIVITSDCLLILTDFSVILTMPGHFTLYIYISYLYVWIEKKILSN